MSQANVRHELAQNALDHVAGGVSLEGVVAYGDYLDAAEAGLVAVDLALVSAIYARLSGLATLMRKNPLVVGAAIKRSCVLADYWACWLEEDARLAEEHRQSMSRRPYLGR